MPNTHAPSSTDLSTGLILASGSPRRSQILGEAGVDFAVDVSGIDEQTREGESPDDLVVRLAREKCLDVAGRRDDAPARPVLGADTIAEGPLLCFLTYDDEHHRIALVNDPDAPAAGATTLPRTTGLEHISFTYAGLGDLLATYERLKEAGITPHWCVNHGATTSMYFLDPDANQVELQVDAFDTLEEVLRDGPPIGEIGVEFDPDDLLARYRDGVPASTLLEQDPSRGRDLRPGRRPA